ncbi:NUDIX hydrolase [Salmonella enterica subsp. enterica serovar Mississippi]|nr:NUDIX hydrolase [Salmonella enterica subsp. enterica serovar Mississippi]
MRKNGTWVKPHQTKATKQIEPPKPTKPVSFHKKMDEKGKKVAVLNPSQPSHKRTWTTPAAVASFTPDGDFPRRLGSVALKSWDRNPRTQAGWNYVEGLNYELDEPPFQVPQGKHPAAGVIIEEDDGRVWLVSPTNAFGGYENTFPKGTCEKGLSVQANAIKEAWEESGLKVEITGILGDFERTTSVARMYIARRTGGNPVDMGWESQAVRLVPKDKLKELLNMETDHSIIDAYLSRKKE